ncbi:MAG TPA: hypothetical protein VL614_26780 [Acetobacteraceae bacterium]|nr:hypothetical protein [Acetobacteraceae bacterium]
MQLLGGWQTGFGQQPVNHKHQQPAGLGIVRFAGDPRQFMREFHQVRITAHVVVPHRRLNLAIKMAIRLSH